jgi:hypothetical protein
VECYVRRNPTYLLDDAGYPAAIEMEQPMCTDESEAQRKAEFILRQSRNGVKLVGSLPPRFQFLKTFKTVALNFAELGWVSKTFRIVAYNVNMDGSVQVALNEEQSGDWTDLDTADYGTPSTTGVPTQNPTVPSEPTSLSVTPTNIAGTLLFTIGEPTVVPLGTRYQIWRSAVSSDFAGAFLVYDGVDRTSQMYAPSSSQFYFARAYVNSQIGSYYPGSNGIEAAPVAIVGTYTSVGSVAVGDRYVWCENSYTPAYDGVLEIWGEIQGGATLEPDSGLSVGMVCAPANSYFTSGPPLQVTVVSSVAALNGFSRASGNFYPSSVHPLVVPPQQFDVRSGVAYTFGWFASVTLGNATCKTAYSGFRFIRR